MRLKVKFSMKQTTKNYYENQIKSELLFLFSLNLEETLNQGNLRFYIHIYAHDAPLPPLR